MKRFSLQKRVSKFAPKKFYEIGPSCCQKLAVIHGKSLANRTKPGQSFQVQIGSVFINKTTQLKVGNFGPISCQDLSRCLSRTPRLIVFLEFGHYSYRFVSFNTEQLIRIRILPYSLLHNNPFCDFAPRYVSSLASIFAGGLACGIHLTNSAEAVAFIVDDAPVDILVLGPMLLNFLRP